MIRRALDHQTPAPPGRGPGLAAPDWGLVAMFGVALMLRTAYAWLTAGPGAVPASDAVSYDLIARHLAAGEGFRLDGAGGSYPTAFVPPVLPWLVSLVYRASGPVYFHALLLQAFLGALVPVVLTRLGESTISRLAGRIAGWLAAVHPLLVFFSGYLLTETVFSLMLVTGLLASAAWLKAPRPGRALGAGILWGAAILTRPTALPMPLLVAAWAWAPLGLTLAARDRLRQLALLAVGVVLVVGPWTLRNAIQMHAFVPVTTGGGRALLDANNAFVWDDPSARGGATSVYHREPYASEFRGLSEVEVDRRSAALARAFLRERAAQAPAMALAKLARFWRLRAEGGGTGHWQAAGSPLATWLARFDPLLLWSLFVLPFALAGLWIVVRGARRWFESLPAMTIVLFTLVSIVYWGSLRLRVPVEPLMMLYAGVGIGAVWRRARTRSRGLRLAPR